MAVSRAFRLDAPWWRGSGWIIACSIALLAASRWLSATSVEYLVLAAIATAIGGALVRRIEVTSRGWAIAALAALALGLAIAAISQSRLARLEQRWDAEQSRAGSRAVEELEHEVAKSAEALQHLASRALHAPPERGAAFRFLDAEVNDGRHALALYHGDSAFAWTGRSRVDVELLPDTLGLAAGPFYLAVYSVARESDTRGIATRVLFAAPPADRMVPSLADEVASRAGVAGFRFAAPSESASLPDGRELRVAGRALAVVAVVPYTEGEVRLRLLERTRSWVGLLLAASLACFIVAAWRGRRSLRWRGALAAVALACVALTPLSAYSNYSRLFDPALYYTPLGWSLTANAAALTLTSAIVLLVLLAAVRRQARFRTKWLAVAAVVVVAGIGPFLLRDLARGIQIPSYGVRASLWLIWEVPLFLAAACVILAGATAGSAVVGVARGLSPWVAPALAIVAAVIAPVVWEAPGQFPWWYTILWAAAIAALAVSRRSSTIIVTAATVAALGATTLVWGATTRSRVRLAEQEVALLGAGDPYARALAERLATRFLDAPAIDERVLLEGYATSELAASGFPLWLATWPTNDSPDAILATASFSVPLDSLRVLVVAAATESRQVGATLPGAPAAAHAIAVPTESGVVTIVVAPKSRLIPPNPFARLLGVEAQPDAEPPYMVQTASLALSPEEGTRPAWRREGNELHGDWIAPMGNGLARVHAEVELRSLEALIQRGTLIVLLNLGIVGLLWFTSVLADGIAVRWIAVRRRRWARSYRIRLTVALFAFFMVPAIAFAIWSYRQLSTDATRARELLVRETLRAVTPDTDPFWLDRESRRHQAPLLLYENGTLVGASDPLLLDLAPTGRLLGPRVAEALLVHGEVTAHRVERVADSEVLFGYRALEIAPGRVGVVAAPARADDLTLGRRARDLGVLVLFATAIGALAALWLSGIAARQLARPIGSLRKAALALAAGEREPILEGQPTAEFLPVFAAFRRMVSDLNASRSALEEAQRRTAAVLRNAASGVIAVDEAAVVTLANPRADELLGAPLPPGTRLSSVAPTELADLVRRFLAGDGEDEGFEMPHGEQQWRGRLTRLVRGGAVVTLDDVSEIARAERVLAWGEMARQVAHEIKNPLTPIRLGVQHLRRARADRRVDFDHVLDQNVERILTEIDRLDEIARAFSRYGQPPEQRAPAESTDVAAILRDLVELETMGEETVRWTVRGAERPLHALARREELRQALLNVFENARLARATDVTSSVDAGNGRVVITVKDNGQGIPPDVLPRIFEPHFSTRTSGSGLGLAVTRRLIESWGGTITLASTEGVGTDVTIQLRPAEPS